MKIIFLVGLIVLLINKAQAGDLICSYKHGSEQIKIKDTGKIEKYEKQLEYGITQLIVINDPVQLSDVENYTTISKSDKSITYSLNCSKLK